MPGWITLSRCFSTSTDAGRRYYVVVPGSANAPLTDAELADVLNYIISAIIKDGSSGADTLRRYDAIEIARYRHERVNNVDEVRQELISQIAKESGPTNPD